MSPHDHMAHFNIDYGSVTVGELQPQKKHAVEVELLYFCLLSDRAGARVRTARNAGRPGRRRGVRRILALGGTRGLKEGHSDQRAGAHGGSKIAAG